MRTPKITRRQALKFGLKSAALSALAPMITTESQGSSINKKRKVNATAIVVGAGAFGGWTALHLLRKGFDVTLIDQFGPGNNQSSSGGETRIIRALYGNRQIYFDLTLRAIQLWKENEPLMGEKILHQNGLVVF